MKVEFSESLLKDLKAAKDKSLLAKVKACIEATDQAGPRSGSKHKAAGVSPWNGWVNDRARVAGDSDHNIGRTIPARPVASYAGFDLLVLVPRVHTRGFMLDTRYAG